MYCEECRLMTQEESCPLCGARKLREVRPDDPCFLVSKEVVWAGMLEEVLKDKGIAYAAESDMGYALSLKIGGHNEEFHFYVNYADYDRARALVDELFSASDEAGLAEEG